MYRNPSTGRFEGESGKFGRFHRQHKYKRVGICAICGEKFAASRRDKRYCSDRCRQQAVTERRIARNDLSPLHEKFQKIVRYLDANAPTASEYIRRVLGSYGAAEAERATKAIFDAMMFVKRQTGQDTQATQARR